MANRLCHSTSNRMAGIVNIPYITHQLTVPTKVAQYTDDCQIICGAILHDVVDDCGVSRDTLLNAENYY